MRNVLTYALSNEFGQYAPRTKFCELAKNVDGYRRSTFMYKDKNSIDGKLKLGPVWDFNMGYGNADFFEGYLTTGWIIISDIYISEFVPFWMRKLFNDSTFANQLNAGQIDNDISFGRKPDGSNKFDYFCITSPGSSNNSNFTLS